MKRTISTHTLEVPGATLVYDVHETRNHHPGPALLMIGQPMDASGFVALAPHFPDRVVVTYDPRGLGRSVRVDGVTGHDPRQQARDLHRLIGALAVGPVDVFGTSGGAVTGLALVGATPADVRVLVAHEPPVVELLPDAKQARSAFTRVEAIYQDYGWGVGMAAFIALTSWPGELTDGCLDQVPDPEEFGLPTEDDGTRNDPLLSGASSAVTAFQPDLAALTAGTTRVVIAAGEESRDLIPWRTSQALADALELELTVFPSHHGGGSCRKGSAGPGSRRRSRNGCGSCSPRAEPPS